MKAVQYANYGGPEALELVECPPPTPASNELLIDVLATSINPIDWKLASGDLKLFMPVTRPAIPGFDVVGVVTQVGAEMTDFSVGQRVVARLDSTTGAASAEQCVVSKAQAVPLPDAIDAADGAALPLAGMTALQALRDDCGMSMTAAKERVLIVGASGGVGHYAVQLAVNAGAHVTGVCSTRNVDMVTSLGAQHVIDYRKTSDYKTDAPYDIIIDCAAKTDWAVFDACLAPNGRVAMPALRMDWLWRLVSMKLFGQRKLAFTFLSPNAADLTLLIDMMVAGTLRSVVGARYPLKELEAAWASSIKGGVAGKIVVEVAS